jgi:uncharacterized membrane protein YvbJ
MDETPNTIPAQAPEQAQAAAQAIMNGSFCPYCGAPVQKDFMFCERCGKPLKGGQLSVTVMMQIGIYAMSLFLPPLGFWPGVKYFRDSDPKAKQIGMIAIALSIVSLILTFWLMDYFMNIYLSSLTGLTGL